MDVIRIGTPRERDDIDARESFGDLRRFEVALIPELHGGRKRRNVILLQRDELVGAG